MRRDERRRNERGCGCLLMLGAVIFGYSAALSATEATPMGIFLAFGLLIVGAYVFVVSYRR